MKTELKALWVEEESEVEENKRAIRADFSNDMHYRVVIINPRTKDHVADALLTLASMIGRDKRLND